MDCFVILSQCNTDNAQPIFEEAVVEGCGVKNYTGHIPPAKTGLLILGVRKIVENCQDL